jgi:hypothetical protein
MFSNLIVTSLFRAFAVIFTLLNALIVYIILLAISTSFLVTIL